MNEVEVVGWCILSLFVSLGMLFLVFSIADIVGYPVFCHGTCSVEEPIATPPEPTWQSSYDCLEWKDTGKLINCEEKTIEKELTSRFDKREVDCKINLGDEWKTKEATFEYPICDVWIQRDRNEIINYSYCISVCVKNEIVCDHEQICVKKHEVLVKE